MSKGKGIDKENINLRIRPVRRKAQITVPSIAKQIKVSNDVFYKIERFDTIPATKQLVDIAKVLNTNVSYLLGFTDTRMPNERYEINLMLKPLREATEKTQALIAKETKLSKSAFPKWEGGDPVPRLDTVITLSNYFSVSPDYFLGLTDIKTWPNAEELELEQDVQIAGQPVQIIHSEKGAMITRWGLINDSENGIVLSDGTIMKVQSEKLRNLFMTKETETIKVPMIKIK